MLAFLLVISKNCTARGEGEAVSGPSVHNNANAEINVSIENNVTVETVAQQLTEADVREIAKGVIDEAYPKWQPPRPSGPKRDAVRAAKTKRVKRKAARAARRKQR